MMRFRIENATYNVRAAISSEMAGSDEVSRTGRNGADHLRFPKIAEDREGNEE